MSSSLALPRLAIAMTLFTGAALHAADVVVQPAAGSGFAVKDSTGTQLRLRVDENGNIVMPVPTGPCAAEPAAGTSLLLLSCTLLFWKTQHEVVFVMSLIPPFAQRPS